MVDQCLPYPGALERDWILWVELWLRAVRHPELRPTAARLYGRMHAWFADAIAAGIEAGEFDAGADPERTADRVLALCDGFGVRALLTELSIDRARAEVWAFLAQELGVDPRDVLTMSPDVVVVGAGTVGGWAGWFASRIGARVTVLERNTAGQGASSRAAGIVRAQGGTPTAVALGRWTIDFYERQHSLIGTDSGFRRLGYLLLARTDAEAAEARERVAMQQAEGLTCAGSIPTRPWRSTHALSRRVSWARRTAPIEGCIDPPRNVRAYMLALQQAGVEVRERCECEELPCGGRARGGRARGRRGDRLLARDPHRRPVAARHRPAARLQRVRGRGAPPGGGHLAAPGVRRRAAADGLRRGRRDLLAPGGGRAPVRLERPGRAPRRGARGDFEHWSGCVPGSPRTCPPRAGLGVRKVWAATIDYTPDHLPILPRPSEGS